MLAFAMRDLMQVFAAAQAGDVTAKGRLLSVIERGGDQANAASELAAQHLGRAYTIGVTGAPGAGKSTLTSALIGQIRRLGDEVAVLAIDPSSPFSGGAILGDRVRMHDHANDNGVFIRSMATRGHIGGLSLATPAAIRALDAVGYRWILVETVGVGQVEVEIAGNADTTIVVVNPGWGDIVQASKAGLMEVADIFCINKADRPGVAETLRDLKQTLALAPGPPDSAAHWRVPIMSTVGHTGEGVAQLWDAAMAHRDFATSTGNLKQRRRERLANELRQIIARRLEQRARELITGARWAELAGQAVAGQIPLEAAAEAILAPVLRSMPPSSVP